MGERKASAPQSADRTIPRLVLAGIGVMLFALAAGSLLHNRIERLMEARDWSDHSLTVQADLEALQLRLDRFDAVARLYLLGRMPGPLREARNLSVVIESGARHMGNMVADNPAQQENLRRLNACAAGLVDAARVLDAPNAAFPVATQLSCREVVELMQEQERVLAERRRKDSEQSTMSLLMVGLLLACFVVLVVLVLFGVLVRDALFRRMAQEQLAASNSQLESAVLVLESHAGEMKMLNDARDQLQMCLLATDAYGISVHFIARLLPGTSGSLCIIDNSRQLLEQQSSWGEGGPSQEVFSVEACCGLRGGQMRWRTPEDSVLHCQHFDGPPPERYLCMPLVGHGDMLGLLHLRCESVEVAEMVERKSAPLRALLQLTSMTVGALNLRSRLENQSIRDSLTGLFNRHFMEITLERELRRATRRESSLAVFMIDADHFKQFNDTFGHKAGDVVLRALAERFLASVRSEDVVCRYGGEEFVVILPDIDLERAADRARQVREAISALRVSEKGQTLGPITVSIGVAVFPQDGRTIDALLQGADRSLYHAKRNGRNRVAFAAETAQAPIGSN